MTFGVGNRDDDADEVHDVDDASIGVDQGSHGAVGDADNDADGEQQDGGTDGGGGELDHAKLEPEVA